MLKNKRIGAKYLPKVINTFILLLFTASFHWLDKIYFRKKTERYVYRKSPVFIIGHWRSGTTLLHNLMSRDPEFGYTTTFHTVFPSNLRSKWIFKNIMKFLMPRNRPGDGVGISPDLPQEDEYALSNITSVSFYHFFYFPTQYEHYYNENVRFISLDEEVISKWLLQYRELTVKSLLNTKGQQALIKNPLHTARISMLLEIFPDAYFIYLVRNPVHVYLSVKKFFSELLASTSFENISDRQLSACIIFLYRNLIVDYLSDRDKVAPSHLIEIRYEELIEKPIDTLIEIYKIFNLSRFNELVPAFEEYVRTQENHITNGYAIERQELEFVVCQIDFAMKDLNYQIPSDLKIIE